MFSPRSYLTAFAALIVLSQADPNAICYSYGVDFVDEGHYFIDGRLTENFSSVSYFKGCNKDVADVLLKEIAGDEVICDQMMTTPDDEHRSSTCPIKKSEMRSGHWLLLVMGNNGDDGQPFAWQRDLYLTVGTPQTVLYTPTVTFSLTSTPISTQIITSTLTDTITTGPLSTITLPSGTADKTQTITPQAVTTTSTQTFTRTQVSITTNLSITTKTATASCTSPARSTAPRPDKPCKYSPTKLHPAAMVTPTTIPKVNRFMRKADRAVDVEWARAQFEAARQRRAAKAQEGGAPLERRAPDQPTITSTASIPVNTTTTILAPATTTTETVLTSKTVTTTLPPPTVYNGLVTKTVTLPTPTKTVFSIEFQTTTKVISIGATLTRTTTITPTSVMSACKKAGGFFL